MMVRKSILSVYLKKKKEDKRWNNWTNNLLIVFFFIFPSSFSFTNIDQFPSSVRSKKRSLNMYFVIIHYIYHYTPNLFYSTTTHPSCKGYKCETFSESLLFIHGFLEKKEVKYIWTSIVYEWNRYFKRG